MSFSVKVLFNKKLLNISADIPWVEKLCLCSHTIDKSEKVYEISITKDIVIITTEYVTGEILTNNINAYDWDGNFLWNIGDIVGDIKMAFDCVSCVFKKNAEKDLGIAISCETDILLECVAGGFIFIVDAINKKLLYKLSDRVK